MQHIHENPSRSRHIDRPSATETTNTGPGTTSVTPKKPTGFAAMDPARQRELASLGGRASHEKGTGHKFNSETGREAAKKAVAARQQTQGGQPTVGAGLEDPGDTGAVQQ